MCNFMVGSTLKSVKLNGEFRNNPSEVWGYEFGDWKNNGWGQDYYYIAIHINKTTGTQKYSLP